MFILYERTAVRQWSIRRSFSSSPFVRHENPLVSTFALLCILRSDPRRASQGNLCSLPICHAEAGQYRSGRCPMSRKCLPLPVAREALARAPLLVSFVMHPSRLRRKSSQNMSWRTVNLAFSLALNSEHGSRPRPRVGVLDLDIFGPSIPKLMALEKAQEPGLNQG